MAPSPFVISTPPLATTIYPTIDRRHIDEVRRSDEQVVERAFAGSW